MTPDDLEADTPWLVRKALAKGTLWSPYQPTTLIDVQMWLWERDEPERSKHFPSKDPPQRLLSWREPYACALVAAASLAEYIVLGEPVNGVPAWRATLKAKEDFSPMKEMRLAGIDVRPDPNMPQGVIVGVDFADIEMRIAGQLLSRAEKASANFGSNLSVLVHKTRKGPGAPAFRIDSVDALKRAFGAEDDDG